ncbi:MAG: ATP-binding cassette domain-containing protein [Patescibacteria group bacterium]
MSIISVQHLTKNYRSAKKTGNIFKDFFLRKHEIKTAVSDVSFAIHEPEFIGFVGPNGAGKTTTMKMLAGILSPSDGKIEVLGGDPFLKKRAYLKQIAFIMGQKNQLLLDLPAVDTFLVNKEIYEIEDGVYKKTVVELSELLNCKEIITQPVKTLSLGQRMRVELISSLLHSPKILFLDEPTIGLDIFAQTIIVKFIKEYQKLYNATVILTSHYMKDIQQLAKRIILIDHGKIIHDGTFADLVQTNSLNKHISVVLSGELDESKMKEKNISYKYDRPVVTFVIEKQRIGEIVSWITSTFEYSDLSIEDEPIEEVIKKVFTKH